MKGEIDKDFYCSAYFYMDDPTTDNQCQGRQPCSEKCKRYHRKFPTPEQFKEEYGKEWTSAVYAFYGSDAGWIERTNARAERESRCDTGLGLVTAIVCACTPFGKPPSNWKPELI